MPSSEELIQRIVHEVEAGSLAVWIKRSLVALAAISIAIIYVYHFRGLATSQAMDQAQIGRSIATWHGWRTEFIRPLAIGQLQAHGRNVTQKIWRDTYNAPLPPLVDAMALFPVRRHLKMNIQSFVSAGDKAIAVMSILIFFASVAVLFFVVRRLFDRRIALLSCGLVVLCDMMWQYSLSGLPQMLLLLLFNSTVYALVRAVEERYQDGPVGMWLFVAGIGFGLLALSHALTLWMFAPALLFALVFFRRRLRVALFLLAPVAILYVPWLLRNLIICGNPAGIGIYSVLDGVGQSEAGWMRRIALTFPGVTPGGLVNKFLTNVIEQSGHIVTYFGFSVVALIFFVALLYRFKRKEANAVRWLIFSMWCGAVAGMALYGMHEEQGVAANQLHLLFVPVMTCFGLAYLLVQWRRLGIELRVARLAFITLLYLICAAPMIFTILFLQPKTAVRWPPYIPSLISVLNNWMSPQEITASDMPWAVAWYADRPSIWLPETIKTMSDLGDYNVLGLPIDAVYLTPVSGTDNTYREILKGEYRDWAPVIERTVTPDKFPLKWATVDLGVDSECVFFSDRDREHGELH